MSEKRKNQWNEILHPIPVGGPFYQIGIDYIGFAFDARQPQDALIWAYIAQDTLANTDYLLSQTENEGRDERNGGEEKDGKMEKCQLKNPNLMKPKMKLKWPLKKPTKLKLKLKSGC